MKINLPSSKESNLCRTSLLLGALLVAHGAASAAVTNDVALDFSLTSNPSGVWSYGSKPTITGSFSLLTSRQNPVAGGGLVLNTWQLSPSSPPLVGRNGNPVALSDGNAYVPAGGVYFWPGIEGQAQNYGVIRFTVPTNRAGTYLIEAAVQCFYSQSSTYAGDSDFHVVTNGVEAFGAALPRRTGTAGYTNEILLAAGATVDFVVGRGADNREYGSGEIIRARLMGPEGELPPPPPPPVVGPCVSNILGLVAWWPFDSNASDLIGSSPLSFSDIPNYQTGMVAQAVSLGGTAGAVSASASSVLNVGSGTGMTVEGWILPANANQMANLVEWNSRYGSIGAHFSLSAPSHDSGGPGCLYANLVDTSATSHLIASPPGIVASGVLQHVALTYDKTSGVASLYLNGAPVATATLGSFTPQTSFDFFVGMRPSGPFTGLQFTGLMDELSLYGRALTSNEIAAIHAANSNGKCRQAQAPVILSQPHSLVAFEGRSTAFQVGAGGSAPLTYQWLRAGSPVADATNATLRFASVQISDAGTYAVVISNAIGFATSDEVTLTVNTAPACAPVPGGVVAWWGLDGNSDDLVGSSALGLAGSPSYQAGIVSDALVLDGGYDFATAPASPVLNLGTGAGLTVEAWIKPSDAARMANLVEWNNRYGVIGAHFSLSTPSSDGGGPGCLYANLVDTAGNSHLIASAPGLLTSGVFQHVVLTYDKASGNAALYLNGAPVAAASLGSFTPQTTFDFFVGTRPSGPFTGLRFAGAIDELSLYNRALAPSEIAAIHAANFGGKCKQARPAVILSQPQSQVAYEGRSASFRVVAGGTAPLTFQWLRDGTPITDAASATLSFTSVQAADAGRYSVVVSNIAGVVTSDEAILTVSAAPACAQEPDGLVAWWPLDGSGEDILGSSTFVFSGGSTFAVAEVAQGLALDGSNDFGRAEASPSLDVGKSSGFSIEAWINPADASRLADLAEWNNSQGGIGAHLSISVPNAYGGGPGSLYANVVDTWGVGHQITTVPGLLASQVFQHVALTYDKASGAAMLYLNGTPVASTNLGTFTPQTSYDLFLGVRPSGPVSGQSFAGVIDELSLYNRALSPNEVQTIFIAATGGKCRTPRTPVILLPPQNLSVVEGGTATFTVAVGGTGPFTYIWLFNGDTVAGETNASLVLSGVQPNQAGSYSVTVTSALGSVTSDPATLEVHPPLPVPPTITIQPVGLATAAGSNVVLRVTASGSEPLSYQWFWNGMGLSEGTNSILVLTHIQSHQAGSYLAVVTNPFGSVTSRPVTINVNDYQGGAVSFGNTFGMVVPYVFDVDGVTRLEGPTYLAQLYAGTNSDALTPVGAAVAFRTGGLAGTFSGGTRYIPSVPPGGTATVQVRAWDCTLGPSFEQALTSGGRVGISDIFTARTGGGVPPAPPAMLLNFHSFSLQPGGTPLPTATNVVGKAHPVLFEPGFVQTLSQSKPLVLGRTPQSNIGQFRFTMWGEVGVRYVIEVSTDLHSWQPLTNFFNAVGPIHVNDPGANGHVRRFYRARVE